jgi:hypothetical protein
MRQPGGLHPATFTTVAQEFCSSGGCAVRTEPQRIALQLLRAMRTR